ncbi:MAG: HNH endonuclease [Pirellulales bacterium]|nr:HNH endonuclease [Pirellulales bacterium]
MSVSAISPDLRQSVARRAGHCCEYVRLPQASQVAAFPVDHVTPRSGGGETELANLALACPQCNALKWIHTVAVDPESGEEVELFNPEFSGSSAESVGKNGLIGGDEVRFLEA